jgi:hypothetical protein
MTKNYKIIITRVGTSLPYEYIGRPSPLGNPLPLSETVSRDFSCDQYEVWFAKQIEDNNEIVINELKRLHKIGMKQGILRLGCYCSPKRCHGDTIKKYLDDNKSVFEMF